MVSAIADLPSTQSVLSKNKALGWNRSADTVLGESGEYQSEMEEACEAAEFPCPGKKAEGILFQCVYGAISNHIEWVSDCVDSGVCEDGGTGKTDHCTYV
jgi:hypothetical protein